MSSGNHLESQFEKQHSQLQANPELNLVSLFGSGKGAESQQAHLSPERQDSKSTAHAFLPKFEIGEAAAPANHENHTATDSTTPIKPGGEAGRSGKGGKRLTDAPDWIGGHFYQGAGDSGASADSPGDKRQPTTYASVGGHEGSWHARNAAPEEGFSASALLEHAEGHEGASTAEHTWSDEKAAHHAAASASTDDYNAQQQQQGDSDRPAWHHSEPREHHHSNFDSASPVASDESADSSTTNVPLDTFTNTSPVAENTSDEPAPIETSNANAGAVASVSAGGNGTGTGSSGSGQQGSSASAPAATNDAGAGIGVANAAGVSQQAANLMASFPNVALTNSGTEPSTNSGNASTGAGANNRPPATPADTTPPATPIDNTPPATTTPPADSFISTPAATSTPPADSPPPTPPAASGGEMYSAAADLAAAESISSMPASPASMTDVGATTTPAPLANPQDLAAVTVNGNDDIESALSGLGTLTEDNGTYTLNANGNQLPPLVLNNVSKPLNIIYANFADVSGGGAVTINGDSSNISITNSNFSNISSGVDIYSINGVMPSGITVDGNTFSDITGPWPSASAVQFAGAGAGEVAADPNGINSVSHNTVIDGLSLASPNSTDANISGQDILSDYNNPYNVPTVFSSNLVDGSYTPADGSHPPDTAINAELSNDEWIAGNLFENQSNAGFGEDGSTNVTVTGNYAENVTSSYNYGPENGINPSGNWTYNNANISPQAGNGWPELYAPDGLPDAPGNSNNWNT